MTHQNDIFSCLDIAESLSQSTDWLSDEGPSELIQTHISVLLLGRRRVLKLKKPVNYGFLDYTTLDQRHSACEAEVRLNRRLCPHIYLGVQPIFEVDGKPCLRGEGRIIDYGVLMERLPDEKMLHRMVASGLISESIIDRVARRLADFHRAARRGPEVDSYGNETTIRRNWDENFVQTKPYIGRTITKEAFDSTQNWVAFWLENHHDLLQKRVGEGRICDGHGDVRCESICVGANDICIFDCIEFNDRFRCGDVAGEAAFLAMDLDARGRPDLGYFFAERYGFYAADNQLFNLLPFYRCYRAFVRGKVLSFRLDEAEFSEAQKADATARAREFFELASRYSAPLRQPTMIAIAGLSGTGKTSLARAVASELGLYVISSDEIRQLLFPDAKQVWDYNTGPYSSDANARTYQAMLDKARHFLTKENGVILDATFRHTSDRKLAHNMAATCGAQWRLIECNLSPEKIQARLTQRGERHEGFSTADWSIYTQQRAEFEMSDATERAHLVVDTSGNLAEQGHLATDWLRANDLS